ncbi:hypothetical protein AJ80_04029 [Polytolypa hystricis UAMH7299]|uniref:Uncharacterized protein n=1 Tax=Polytolypa hystricis (strain UAMH7299) TaxID=1447883 RepID=A0A2B7YCM2_POLH7|nr:hypothetical protein AJ80_04029 [Polytolypa hystricis UAMH7299]
MDDTEISLDSVRDEAMQDILQHFRGHAKVDLYHLAPESNNALGSRPVGENATQNAERLLEIFESGLCDRLDPDNHVPVLISEDTLNKAIDRSKTSQEALLRGTEIPHLEFDRDTQLPYLQGKSRLTAAGQFLEPGNRWWGVRLYLDSLPTTSKTHLREKNPNARNFNDGDSYRNYRYHQLEGNVTQEKSWWARWDPPKRKVIEKMQKVEQLCDAFDLLLPFVGLWASVNVKLFRRVVECRLYEESKHYLRGIFEIWSKAFPGDTAPLVDAPSVLELEGLMPHYSITDQDRIRNLMRKGLFPAVIGENNRDILLQVLLDIPGRILTLHTFAQDLIYCESSARALRALLPKGFKGTVRKAMERRCDGTGNKWCIQVSTHEYEEVGDDSLSWNMVQQIGAKLSYVQLWLCALRLFVVPFKDSGMSVEDVHGGAFMRGMPLLAGVARNLGFRSKEIDELCQRDIGLDTCRHFLERICEVELVTLDSRHKENTVRQLSRMLKQLLKNSFKSNSTPAFTSNNDDKCRRYNRPNASQFRNDRQYFFIKHIYSCDQPAAQHPTSFAITREVIFSFFGKEPLYRIFRTPAGAPSQEAVDPTTGNTDNQCAEIPIQEVMITVEASQDTMAAKEANINSAVSPNSHRPGSEGKEMLGIESTPPLAPGFEDVSAPLNREINISVHRGAKDILQLWHQSPNPLLIVLYVFTSRSYYKILKKEGLQLRSTISTLASGHYFMAVKGDRFYSLSNDQILVTALCEGILYVGNRAAAPRDGSQDPLGSVDNSSQGVSQEELEQYVSSFDVKTGKRRRDGDGRAQKRARNFHPDAVMDQEEL